MNSYGLQAQAHWRRWLPHRYASLPDPTSHFTRLGQLVETRIGELTMELAGPDQPGEGYLRKVGRLNNARSRAQETVLRELVLLDPEPGVPDLDEETSPAPTHQQPLTSDWIPVVEDPSHPYWSQIRDQRND